MTKVISFSKIKRHPNNALRQHSFAVVASGVLFVGGRVLLLQRSKNSVPDPGAWTLPCGHIEATETPEQAVVRELMEETSLIVQCKQLISIEHYFYDYHRTRTIIMEFIYLVELTSESVNINNVKLDRENQAYKFVPLRDLKKYQSLATVRKVAIKKGAKII